MSDPILGNGVPEALALLNLEQIKALHEALADDVEHCQSSSQSDPQTEYLLDLTDCLEAIAKERGTTLERVRLTRCSRRWWDDSIKPKAILCLTKYSEQWQLDVEIENLEPFHQLLYPIKERLKQIQQQHEFVVLILDYHKVSVCVPLEKEASIRKWAIGIQGQLESDGVEVALNEKVAT